MFAPPTSRWPLLLAFVVVLLSALPAMSAPTVFLINGYIQGRYTQTVGEESTNLFTTENFDAKRSYVWIHAGVDQHIGAVLMVGGTVTQPGMTKSDVEVQEAYAEYVNKAYQGRLGLSRIPFGYEVPLSSAKLITTERSWALTKLVYPQAFERGAYGYYLPKTGLNVSLGVTNGEAANVTFNPTTHKNALGRVGYTLASGQQFGVSFYTGHNPYPVVTDATGKTLNIEKLNLIALDAEVPVGPFTIISEYVQGTQGEAKIAGNVVDNAKPRGGYLTLAYQKDKSPYQPYARYDFFQPDKNIEAIDVQRATAGINYLLTPGSKVTLEYELIRDDQQPNLDGRGTVQYQVAF